MHASINSFVATLSAALILTSLLPAQSNKSATKTQNLIASASGPDKPASADTDRSSSTGTAISSPAPSIAASFDSAQPPSLFDAVTNTFRPVTTYIEVHGLEQDIDSSSPEPFQAGGQDILTTAGTYGDISRYLQILPGVVATSDLSNQMLVRGGHPMENLFLVDNIEVPNINHIADANSTGGFGPMIDAAAIQGLKLHTGGYDAKFPERLSSVTEFRTLESRTPHRRIEADLGIQGAGGLVEKNIHGGDLLVSAHHGLVNVVSHDIGIGATPSYTNELTRYRKNVSAGSRLSLLNVAGWDSIDMTPCIADPAETNTIESDYHGWRETTWAEWSRIYGPRSFGELTVSDSEQIEHISQEDQPLNPWDKSHPYTKCPLSKTYIKGIPVYEENSNNAFSTIKYRYEWGSPKITFSVGSSAWLQRPHFRIAQPIGALSPYSVVPVRTDSTSFNSYFSTGETGTYSQFMVRPVKPLSLSAGGRMQTFAFGDHTSFTPRLSASYRIGEYAGIHAAFGTYDQLPPYVYMLAYQGNRSLLPMRATHEIAGMDLWLLHSSQVRLEAYNKDYTDIPASTEYPGVTMHTLVDMVGDQFVWLPMKSMGRGNSSGIELSDISRLGSRFQIQGSIAYSRSKFSGLDKILRPSNFDFPWIINAVTVDRIGHGMIASARYGYATGRPYTPYNFSASMAQNRPIYDLTLENVPRTPYYARLDLQVNKDIAIRSNHLELYAGVDNILNRYNFLSYAWMPRYQLGLATRDPVGTLWQSPIFPNFGVRMIFR